MAAAFEKHGFTWEPVKVHTDDGYTLTAFHVTGKVDGVHEITRPSLVLQHCMGMDSRVWTMNIRFGENGPDPMAFQFAEMGFDVWIANNAGNPYSQVHDVYTVDDKEFWAFDWRKHGVYDFPALVTEIQSRNGGKKVALLGHSQGTTQTFAGMGIIPEWYDANVSVAALLGPCTHPNPKFFTDLYTEENWSFLEENDIWVTNGPHWEEKREIIISEGP